MSQLIFFTKSRLGVLSQLHKQTAELKWKEGQLLPPCSLQSIKQGLCFITFPWGLQKFCKEFFDYCITFISNRKWAPTTCCMVRIFIIRGENNDGWAEIHARMHSSARLPFFPGEIDSGSTGAFLSAVAQEAVWLSVHITITQYTKHSEAMPTSTTIVVFHASPRWLNESTLMSNHGWDSGNTFPCPVPKWPCHVSPGVRPRPWPKL